MDLLKFSGLFLFLREGGCKKAIFSPYNNEEEKDKIRKDMMNLPNDLLERIASRYTHLKGNSERKYGLSPFRSEKHPSFVIFPDGYYHDFGNGFHGDAIDLVMRMESLSFPEAVFFIEREYGIKLPIRERNRRGRKTKEWSYQDFLREIGWTSEDRLRYLKEEDNANLEIIRLLNNQVEWVELEGKKVPSARTYTRWLLADELAEEWDECYHEEKRRIDEDRRELLRNN